MIHPSFSCHTQSAPSEMIVVPFGIAAAGLEARRARREPIGVPRQTLAILRVNVLFLLAAVAVTGWFFFAATYRPS